jgi:hypothetical protein
MQLAGFPANLAPQFSLERKKAFAPGRAAKAFAFPDPNDQWSDQ